MSHIDKLSATLFGRTRRAVLALLYGHPDEAFYLREIIRMTHAGPGAVQRELQSLTDAGILRRETRGRQVYYQADYRCPVFAELKSLATKTVAAADPLRSALAPLQERIRAAFIYGSVARNEPHSQSDLDLIVVGDVSFSQIVSALAPAQEALQREINPTVYTAVDFRAKVNSGHHFIGDVLRKKKVFLVGDEHELKRLDEERVVGEAPAERRRDSKAARTRRP